MDFTRFTLEEVNALNKNTLMEVLGIECIELGVNSINFKMPVDSRTHQPMGILHGGASAALIETVGSFGSFLMADPKNERPVGLSINAEHIRAVRNGNVIATGTLIHPGGSTHIWQVNIHEETTEQLVCTGRLTIMRIKKQHGAKL
jgi:1,4-dihydroxy-2-naphthoyl-CoA hydrolase